MQLAGYPVFKQNRLNHRSGKYLNLSIPYEVLFEIKGVALGVVIQE